MRIENLKHLYEEQLADLRDTETELQRAMSTLAPRTTARELRAALEEEADVTERQSSGLDDLMEDLDASRADRFRGPAAMVKDLEVLVERCDNPEVRDAAIIAGLQRIKHYEIAGYGCARAYAEQLGEGEAAERLGELLEEESKEDEKLTRLANESINQLAAEPATV